MMHPHFTPNTCHIVASKNSAMGREDIHSAMLEMTVAKMIVADQS